jgi:outer membrane protein assembly factor BamB
VKGYTLVTPMNGHSTYLLDMSGQVVHEWRYPAFRSFYARLLPSGALAMLAVDNSITPPQVPEGRVPTWTETVRRIGGNATHLVELDWDSNVVWQYENHDMHHDFVRLANGNTLVSTFIELPSEVERAVRGGFRERFMPPMLSDDYVEVDSDGKEVRRVNLWKLLDPVRDPICPLDRRLEWTHTNSLDVTPDGSILFSTRHNSRVGLIDTEGKLTWKFGFPEISHQHHATVLPNGHVQIFDNGMHRRGNPRSAVVEVDPKTSRIVWQYTANPEIQFLSAHISSAERLQGGNVLICEGAPGRVFEVTSKGEVVWEWVNPFEFRMPNGNINPNIFRAHRYGADHAALRDRKLDPKQHAKTNRLYGLTE